MTMAAKTWFFQALAGVIAILVVTLWHTVFFTSVLLGVVTMMLATFYWVFRMWRIERRFGQGNPKVVRAFYLGQVVKYIILIVAVILFLNFLKLDWLAFVIGVVAVQVGSTFMVVNVKRMAST